MKHKILHLVLGLLLTHSVHSGSVILTEMSGKKILFENLRGKWIMINYWASWCQACIDEIDELNAFYRKNLKNVVLYAVNYDGVAITKQNQLIKKYNIVYPSLRTDPSAALHLNDLAGVPVTFVFDKQGHLVDTLYGGQTQTILQKIIQ